MKKLACFVRNDVRGRGPQEEERREASEERFLSAQADPFAGVKGKEKVGLLRSK
jgi:hypothetical protein